jgi:hypothetical protein
MAGQDKRPVSLRPGEGGAVTETASVDAFLAEAKRVSSAPKGRLIFALDATMSRQPTWDMACALQADMFEEAAAIGGLAVQLVYFRGANECRASRFVNDPRRLGDMMATIDCRGGHTQIVRVLRHVREAAGEGPVSAFVLVGDAMEEAVDDLCAIAGELGLKGVKGFLFHEGTDGVAENAFREIARLTGGAYAQFAPGAAAQLRSLLRAAAAYAAGGSAAVRRLVRAGQAPAVLLTQLR